MRCCPGQNHGAWCVVRDGASRAFGTAPQQTTHHSPRTMPHSPRLSGVAVRKNPTAALRTPGVGFRPLMRSVAITLSGVVAAPIDRVFDLLTDPHRAPDWLPGCQSVRVNGSPGRKGERWHLRVRTPLRTADLQIEILEYTPPTGFAWHEIVPRSGSKTYFKLEFQGGTTEVMMKHVWTPPSFSAWLKGVWFRRRKLARQFDGALQNFRKILTR